MSTPGAWGLSYEDVIGLSWMAYAGQGTRGRWRMASGIWEITSVFEQGSYRAVTVKSPSSKKILSFSGTDDIMDWGDNIIQGLTGFSSQYALARVHALFVNPDIVTGHSLGGGLASYAAINNFTNAATINPAPLNLTGLLGSNILPRLVNSGKVVNYVVRGEALDILDDAALSMRRVGTIHNVSSGGSSPIDKHLIPNLSAFRAPTRV
ncbi:MAG: hypothetical protein R2681_10045 [Pyrinomonadaceae bacterium]